MLIQFTFISKKNCKYLSKKKNFKITSFLFGHLNDIFKVQIYCITHDIDSSTVTR